MWGPDSADAELTTQRISSLIHVVTTFSNFPPPAASLSSVAMADS